MYNVLFKIVPGTLLRGEWRPPRDYVKSTIEAGFAWSLEVDCTQEMVSRLY